MKYSYAVVILLFSCMNVLAQPGAPVSFHIPRGAVTDLSAMEEDIWLTEVVNLEAKDHFGNPDKKFLYKQKQQSAQLFPRKHNAHAQLKSTLSVNPPVLNRGFDGNTSNGSVPLDNYMAISDSGRIVSVSNTRFVIYDTLGNALSLRTLTNFCQPLGLNGFNNGKFDPKVMYDPEADRFVAVILNASTAAYSRIVLAFSQTGDPEGAWNLYALPGNPFNDTTWLDYPAINITHDEIFITGNQVKQNVSWQLGFKQTVIWQVRKDEGYAGDTLVTNLWSNVEYNGKKLRNLHPVKGGPDLKGPNQYFLSNRNFDIQNDTVFLLEVTDTIGAPGAQLQVSAVIADKPYGVPPSVPQPGSNQYLATNDGRILSAIYHHGEIQFASNSVDTSTGRAAIYFGVIDGVDNQTYSLQASIIGNDTLDFGYPNMSWVGDGAQSNQTIVSFEHCSEVRPAGMSAIFYSDGEFSDLVTVKEGTGTLNILGDSLERWGDYSGSQPVYNRDGKIWVCGTYASPSNAYATWIAQLDNPYGVSTGIKEPKPPVSIGKLFPNPASSYVSVKFELPSAMQIIIDIVDIQGKKIGTAYQGETGSGMNQVSFQTGHLSPGVYFVQIHSGGKLLHNLKFIKNP